MNLKFVCSENFEIAAEICHRIQGYLPDLVHDVEVIRTEAFNGVFSTWEVLPKIFTICSSVNRLFFIRLLSSLYADSLLLTGPVPGVHALTGTAFNGY